MNFEEKTKEIIRLGKLGWKVKSGRLVIPTKLYKKMQTDFGLNEAIQLEVILRNKEERNSVWLCKNHGGYGFKSDCKKCKEVDLKKYTKGAYAPEKEKRLYELAGEFHRLCETNAHNLVYKMILEKARLDKISEEALKLAIENTI